MTIRLFLLLISIFLANYGHAQFGVQQVITSMIDPRDVVLDDLDGDGDLDLLFAGYDDQQFGWFENEGQGQFGRYQTIDPHVPEARVVASGDIDGDGDPDVLTARMNKINLWSNSGSGEFTAPVLVEEVVNRTFLSVEMADVDADGDLDIVAATTRFQSDQIIWYANAGNGQFGAGQLVGEVGSIPQLIQVNDLDNDGMLDILATSARGNTVFWYRNVGGGQFSVAQTISTEVEQPEVVRAADLDADGDLDVLSVSSLDNKVAWYANDGTGQFGSQQLVSTSGIYPTDVAAADLDADGDLDLVSTSSVEDEVVWYANDGTGQFGAAQCIDSLATNTNEVRIGDLNGDGNLDVLAISEANDDMFWYANDGAGQFASPQIIGRQAKYVRDLITADIDGNGHLDVVSASSDDGKIAWYPNQGQGLFGDQQIIHVDTAEAISVAAADVDGDGDLDVLASFVMGGPKLTWYENVGDGQFGSQQLIAVPPGAPWDIAVDDLNGDGRPDLVYGYFGTTIQDGIAWRVNEGNGQWGTAQLVTTQLERPDIVRIVDLDNDGDLDVLAGSKEDDLITWYANDGNGQFGGQLVISTTPLFINDLHAADLDFDGDVDVISADFSTRRVDWYENLGDGQFRSGELIEDEIFAPSSVVAADLDLDGDAEVLVAYSNSSIDDVVWFENGAGAGFGPPQRLGAPEQLVSLVRTADLDADGDEDVIVVSLTDNRIAWHENFAGDPTITGRVFWDENENALFDAEEEILTSELTRLTPDPLYANRGAPEGFTYYVEDGSYQVELTTDSCWAVTTDSLSYQVEIDGTSVSGRDFGVMLASDYQKLEARLTAGPTRCGFTVPFWLSVQHTGCAPTGGRVGVVLNDLVQLRQSAIPPDMISGDTLWWEVPTLAYRERIRVPFSMEIAGVEFLGDTIRLPVLSFVRNDNGNLQQVASYLFESEINCAYDPNDKLVEPQRGGEASYALFDESLAYTVRFQNTGTDTAFNVVIRDTLDAALEWESLEVIAASHPQRTQLDFRSGALTFDFKDILLPDSLTNFVGSQGFVSYRIDTKAELAEGTIIKNRAGIYFDFNPPIITNTVFNTLVAELPNPTNVHSLAETVELSITAYPNPFLSATDLEVIMPQADWLKLQVYGITGQLLATQAQYVSSGKQLIHLPPTAFVGPGVYLIRASVNKLQGTTALIKIR